MRSFVSTGSATIGGLAAGALGYAGALALRDIGAPPSQTAPRTHGSPNRLGQSFANLEPPTELAPQRRNELARAMLTGTVRGLFTASASIPTEPIAVSKPVFAEAAELALTWLGHATVLLEIEGKRVLTDPVFSRRCSPSQLVGPVRMHPVPCAVDELPAIDVVLLSHDHYDHLDRASVVALAAYSPAATFVCPIGVGAHLARFGVDGARIVEADWGQTVHAAGLRFDCTYARHFSGRGLTRNHTLWCGWVISGQNRRAYFSGDTGTTERFADIGAQHGPIDLTMIAIGAYHELWPDIHLNPEEALAAHRAVRGEVMLPIHWATFNLAPHAWADPIVRLLESAGGATVVTPPPGGQINVTTLSGSGIELSAWWKQSA